jgi:uncharacterized repeat protein (TIGR03803 family)
MRRLMLLAFAVVLVTVSAHAQSYSVLYNFGTKAGDPVNPEASGVVAQGRDGNLYSTALGGANGLGAMFKITPSGTLTVPYSFDSTDPEPYSGLTLGTDGNFYGTSGDGSREGGIVYKITPSGKVTVLHTIGHSPLAPPIQGADSNFYGTTSQKGTNSYGTVYKVTPSGKYTTLYSFDYTHGSSPVAPLVQGTDGNFYGTTPSGGKAGHGTVFKVTSSGKLTVLRNFGRGRDGATPLCALVQGSDGNFYGTTTSGGTYNAGVVFRITATGTYTILHSIKGSRGEGYEPYAGLIQATDGNLYGTALIGGTAGQGTIFMISPIEPYPYTVLHNFDLATGAQPEIALVQHTNGVLYGDTILGGTGGPCGGNGSCGVFYSFNLGLQPFVSLVSTSGKVGKTIGILGQGFTGTTGVAFNGTAANFKVSSDTYLTATVPNGATTGSVTVMTPSGTLTSNKPFRVTRLN